jgi:hypothetical protein
VAGIDKGDLPAVAFYKPQGESQRASGQYRRPVGRHPYLGLVARIKTARYGIRRRSSSRTTRTAASGTCRSAQGRPLGAEPIYRRSSAPYAKKYVDPTSYDDVDHQIYHLALDPLLRALITSDLTSAFDFAQ